MYLARQVLKYRPVAFTGLSCISAREQWYHDVRIGFACFDFGIVACFVIGDMSGTYAIEDCQNYQDCDLIACREISKTCAYRCERIRDGHSQMQSKSSLYTYKATGHKVMDSPSDVHPISRPQK